ncbi:MAG TPA: hypothetical protein VJH89_00535, partial [Patescibacteria group bacterium]|nr:hypothetical protein [Patescibacteria group bacterium]
DNWQGWLKDAVASGGLAKKESLCYTKNCIFLVASLDAPRQNINHIFPMSPFLACCYSASRACIRKNRWPIHNTFVLEGDNFIRK